MTGAVHMGMKDKVTVKLLQATSDKTELNKKALQWKKSFVGSEQNSRYFLPKRRKINNYERVVNIL